MTDTQNLIARLRSRRFCLDEVAEIASQAADEIERLQRELDAARKLREAVENLVKVKGRHNTAIAYERLASTMASRS